MKGLICYGKKLASPEILKNVFFLAKNIGNSKVKMILMYNLKKLVYFLKGNILQVETCTCLLIYFVVLGVAPWGILNVLYY